MTVIAFIGFYLNDAFYLSQPSNAISISFNEKACKNE